MYHPERFWRMPNPAGSKTRDAQHDVLAGRRG